jgi:hypothetical protein
MRDSTTLVGTATVKPMVARARATDPATSHEAAELVEATGRANSQRRAVYDYVRAHPSETGSEIARGMGWERAMVSRRLPELRGAGLLVTGKARVCTVSGTNQMTWSATA